MPTAITCRSAPRVAEFFPDMLFTAVTATDIDLLAFAAAANACASQTTAGLGAPAAETVKNLDSFEAFFVRHDRKCTLRSQITSAAERGFPPVPPPVLAMLALEAATGVLMGVQNLDAIVDFILLDVLSTAESFIGMRGKPIICPEADLVVRDRDGIIASVFQGPDRRTAVDQYSRDLLFYVFDSDPSIGIRHRQAATVVSTLLRQCSDAVTILSADVAERSL